MVEDVHWADAATLECLADLACAVREVPALLIMTSRPQGDPIYAAWRASAAGCPLLTLDIGPLGQTACRRLAQPYALDVAAVASCIERSGGNPLFLVQLLRHAARGGGSVPGSVQSIVLARLDRLEPQERQWLQAACVFGPALQCRSSRGDCGRFMRTRAHRAGGPAAAGWHGLSV